MFLLVLALCCRSTCQFRGNSEKSNHMLSATSHIGLEFLTKFLNMSKLQNRLILLYQSLPLQNMNSCSAGGYSVSFHSFPPGFWGGLNSPFSIREKFSFQSIVKPNPIVNSLGFDYLVGWILTR